MPQQPPPQSPLPDEPATPSPTPGSTGGNPQQGVPQQAGGRATPPGGTPGPSAYAPQGPYRPSPAHANGHASASGGFGPGGAPGVPRGAGYPTGPAPGYGPPGYAPGTGPAAWSGQPASARPTQAFDATAGATTATGPTGATTVVATSEEPKKKDLTVNKLVAGAGAAATSAVLGSFFGAMGTVSGAALGSVFSAIVTALYQHSLDKTRDTVKARIKLPGGGTVNVASTTEVPAPRGGSDQTSTRVFVTPGDQPTEVLSAVPAVDAGPPKSGLFGRTCTWTASARSTASP